MYDKLWVRPRFSRWPNFMPFYGWVILHCVCVPHLLCPLLCGWIFRLLPGMKTWSRRVLGVTCYTVTASRWGSRNCFLILVFVSSGAHPGPFNVLRTELPVNACFLSLLWGICILVLSTFLPPTISANLTRILWGNEFCHWGGAPGSKSHGLHF